MYMSIESLKFFSRCCYTACVLENFDERTRVRCVCVCVCVRVRVRVRVRVCACVWVCVCGFRSPLSPLRCFIAVFDYTCFTVDVEDSYANRTYICTLELHQN